jgi:hypothetical protein
MYYSTPDFAAWYQRVDLRDETRDPENPTDKTNAVADATYNVTKSENYGKLSASAQSNCGPLPPASLSATAISAGEIDLSWTAASDMDYYTLSHTDNNGITVYPEPFLGAGISGYNDISVSQGSTYTYTLTSINSFGTVSSYTTATTPLLAIPGTIQSSVSTSGIPTITWSSNANSYNILRSSDGGKTYVPVASNITTTSFTDKTAQSGKVYTYEVQAKSGSAIVTSNSITVFAIYVSTTCSKTNLINYTNTSQVPSGGSFTTNTITAGTNVVIASGLADYFWSGTKVQLKPGFSAKSGSTFQAKIVACTATKSAEPGTPSDSILQDNKYLAIKIYPNPTNGTFTVSNNSTELYSISVYNLSGILVKEVNNCQSNANVDISIFPAGIYIIKVSGQSALFVGKLLKE